MIDKLLHVGGGLLCGLAILWLPPSLGALLFAFVLGLAREWDQRVGRPPWRWSLHAWAEALAWPLGAALAVAVWAAVT